MDLQMLTLGAMVYPDSDSRARRVTPAQIFKINS